jgi:ketosteroid isomerase-like protein
MSEENVEAVRAIFEAFNRRDISSMLDHVDPEIEWLPAITPGGIEGNVYRGHAGIRRWMDDVSESWGAMEVSDLTVQAVGNRVLALGRVHGEGRASGVPVDRELAQLWEFDKGKGRRAIGFMSHADALQAAGLSE